MTYPSLNACMSEMPLIAILRGLDPSEAVPVVETLFVAGFRIAEVPINRPGAFESIANVVAALGDKMVIGAGTVLTVENVAQVASTGGRVVISPNYDPEVVVETKELGLYSCPGVQTPSEAFAALKRGADVLKLFPAEAIAPKVVKSMRAVLPGDVSLVPVGSVGPQNMAEYWAAGAAGFGLGLNLYQPGKDLDEVRRNAEAFATLMREIKAGTA